MNVPHPIPPIPNGFEALTVSDTETPVALTVPTGSRYGLVRVLDDDVRIRMEGATTLPTSLTGFQLRFDDAQFLELTSKKQLDDFRVVRDNLSSATATVLVLYYKLSET